MLLRLGFEKTCLQDDNQGEENTPGNENIDDDNQREENITGDESVQDENQGEENTTGNETSMFSFPGVFSSP
jgi:hypothetical protein